MLVKGMHWDGASAREGIREALEDIASRVGAAGMYRSHPRITTVSWLRACVR